MQLNPTVSSQSTKTTLSYATPVSPTRRRVSRVAIITATCVFGSALYSLTSFSRFHAESLQVNEHYFKQAMAIAAADMTALLFAFIWLISNRRHQWGFRFVVGVFFFVATAAGWTIVQAALYHYCASWAQIH